MLQPLQDDSEPFLRQYFGTQYRGLKVLVSFVVHALGPIREQRSNARPSTKPHANFIGSAQSPIVAIFPFDLEIAPSGLAADEHEAQELERLRFAKPALLAVLRRKAAELNQGGSLSG